MAWVADNLWSHPKVVGLPAEAKWLHCAAIMYASGYGTRGVLNDHMLATASELDIRAVRKLKTLLVERRLWVLEEGGVRIHDWDEHNERRDERRARDRERKREARRAKETTKR